MRILKVTKEYHTHTHPVCIHSQNFVRKKELQPFSASRQNKTDSTKLQIKSKKRVYAQIKSEFPPLDSCILMKRENMILS